MKINNYNYNEINPSRFIKRIHNNLKYIFIYFIFIYFIFYFFNYFIRNKLYKKNIIFYVNNSINYIFNPSNVVLQNSFYINKINILKEIIKSKTHNEKIINYLNILTTYYKNSDYFYNDTEIYKSEIPFLVKYDNNHIQCANTKFYIKILNNNKYEINFKSTKFSKLYDISKNIIYKIHNKFFVKKIYNFNEWVINKNFKFKIIKNKYYINQKYKNLNFSFLLNIKDVLIDYFIKNIKIDNNNLENYYNNLAIIKCSIVGLNPNKISDYINTSIDFIIKNQIKNRKILYDNNINIIYNKIISIQDRIIKFSEKMKNIKSISNNSKINSFDKNKKMFFNFLLKKKYNSEILSRYNYLFEQNFFENYHEYVINNFQYTNILNKLYQYIIVDNIYIPDINIIDKATEQENNYFTYNQSLKEYILLFIFNVIILFFILILQEIFDDKIILIADIIQNTNYLCIGELNFMLKNKIKKYTENLNNFKETIRFFRESIKLDNYYNNNNNSIILTITSYIAKEGKTFFATNISKSFSYHDKTIILDINFISPYIHHIFKKNNDIGLSDYLLKNIKIKDIVKKSKIKNLDLITIGNNYKNNSEILFKKKFISLIFKLQKNYKYIVLDTSFSNYFNNFNLINISNLIIYIVRHNYNYKKNIININKFFNYYNINTLRFIFNKY